MWPGTMADKKRGLKPGHGQCLYEWSCSCHWCLSCMSQKKRCSLKDAYQGPGNAGLLPRHVPRTQTRGIDSKSTAGTELCKNAVDFDRQSTNRVFLHFLQESWFLRFYCNVIQAHYAA